MAIALDMKNGISHENSNIIEFPVIDVASAIGWDSGIVKSHLKSLEWKTEGKNPTFFFYFKEFITFLEHNHDYDCYMNIFCSWRKVKTFGYICTIR